MDASHPNPACLSAGAVFLSIALTVCFGRCLAQEQPAPASTAQSSPSPEMATQESATTFKVNVKEVLVRVVARDSKGDAVGNLTKDDFQIFDKGKPQVITHFSVEQPGVQAAKERKTSEQNADTAAAGPKADVPERFVAYLFDDIHLQFGDLARVRDAAERHFAGLRPTDRAAVFSTSGQTVLDYTDDRTKLHETLLRLKPTPISGSGATECPDISYYMADQIVNKDDKQMFQVAVSEALSCNASYSALNGTMVTGAAAAAQAQAQAQAHMVLARGEQESRVALDTLKSVVRSIVRMPGERSVVLISPGFIIPDLEPDFYDIVDHALRAQTIISAVDARGLYALIPGGDASEAVRPEAPLAVVNGIAGADLPPASAYRSTFDSQEAFADSDILESFADATGGIFFHNSNDLDEGFKRAAATPAYFYLIGFTPQNLKPDGSFHELKVTLKPSQKLTLQARRGYYAPKHLPNQEEEAKQEIQDAIFSQEEMHEVPLDLHTQFFKASDAEARLTVLAHLDIRQLHFRKVEGRNGEELTVVSALFDRNGTFIQGNQKTVTFRLKDETLANRLNHGITMKTSFDAKPGSYLVRVVVRDADGGMSAQNGAVEIP